MPGARAEPTPRGELAGVVARNIDVLVARRQEEERSLKTTDRLAQAIGRFSGSLPFVWVHLVLVAFWVAVNVGLVPFVPRFDSDFVKLATVASVEAIFLSTFVLLMQNRVAAVAEKRADLDLQISLLSEHEVTRLIRMVDLIAQRLGIGEAGGPDVQELKKDVAPELVLDEIKRRGDGATGRGPPPE